MSNSSLNSSRLDSTEHLTRRGLAVMWSGAKRERVMFALAVTASVVFGFLTVADAWVLGWATDEAIVPAFQNGDTTSAAIWAAAFAFLIVALIRTLAVIGRRLFGGIVYYRLVRDDRLNVTRAYVRLPLSWHRKHSTGSLLSNANADVEARWGVFTPRSPETAPEAPIIGRGELGESAACPATARSSSNRSDARPPKPSGSLG